MNVSNELAAVPRLPMLAVVMLISACAGPGYGPIVQDLSVTARASERLSPSGQASTAVVQPASAALPKLQPQAPAVTITAQPQTSQIEAANVVKVQPVQQIKPVATISPSPVTAVVLPASDQRVVEQLLAEADQLKAQGKVTQSVIQLQRAQRIAPREPKVYARLAALQLSLGEASRAEQLALKGLTLVPQQNNYQYYFWKLIAASRSHLGDVSGESAAISEAAKYK
ncbi:MAG: hypothetical protein HOH02_08390 [Oceanospirillaceae bacterium]|nr:hypothetical protein [Oceanospirillaceae bacterium]MBT6077959.1 hypothetical protein [Oceanospirillaceae bacterium]MBT7330399.1 hypothetical protein [Oceanospirillaceae bacterium]